jgi:hypothetical protein
MEVVNTLAYCNTATITDLKSFIVQAPRVNVTTLFSASLMLLLLKNFFLSLASFLRSVQGTLTEGEG